MSNSGIGIPQVEPRHRVGWQDARHSPDRNKDKDEAATGKRSRPPPQPGTGEVVDQMV
jgi:hypothetical protein